MVKAIPGATCDPFIVNSLWIDLTAGGEGMSKCPDTSVDMYCCVDNTLSNCHCTSGSGALRFNGQPSALNTIGVKPTSTIVSISSSSTVAPSSSLYSIIPSISTSSSATPRATDSSATVLPSPAPLQYGNNSAAIGAGVGVPLGIIALIALFFLYRRYKKRRALRGGSGDGSGIPMIPYRPGGDKGESYSNTVKENQHQLYPSELLGSAAEYEAPAEPVSRNGVYELPPQERLGNGPR